jgi:membrane associated rhomboid family serine protease
MLDDRDYMRSASPQHRWSLTTVLLLANAVIFVIQAVAVTRFGSTFFDHYLALSLSGLAQGQVWQLLTFQFLHAGLFHLLGNLLAIYCFGRAIEESVGPKALAQLYFGSGIMGGLLQMLGAWAVPSEFGGSVVGASAGAFGLVAAFAMMFPDRVLTLLIFFVIPLSMRARTLLWLSIALAGVGILLPGDGVAHLAHLGGIGAGCAFVRWVVHSERAAFDWARLGLRRKPRSLARVGSGQPAPWGRAARLEMDEELPSEEFISREVDPILDKISAHGLHSLTERERKILERARSKMARR